MSGARLRCLGCGKAHGLPPALPFLRCRENTVVKSLDLSSNGVEYEGIKALAEALVSNTTLEQLSLSDNYIGVQGALVLANGLRGNKSLKSISIAGNDLGDGGCGERPGLACG